MIETTWTMERITLLKDRMRAGFSCGQIARELGVSRNAVIGKTNRLGLSRFKNAIPGQSPRTVTRQKILRALWAKPQIAFAKLSSESVKACSLLELQQWHCRWPMGDQPQKISVSAVTVPLPVCPIARRRRRWLTEGRPAQRWRGPSLRVQI